ncbi:MAG TPA: hypothetical protein VFW05_03145 [Verrucomicrobiae bacterium]|nr:hypothetical protein [Verrucomicrobiae bacterium]
MKPPRARKPVTLPDGHALGSAPAACRKPLFWSLERTASALVSMAEEARFTSAHRIVPAINSRFLVTFLSRDPCGECLQVVFLQHAFYEFRQLVRGAAKTGNSTSGKLSSNLFIKSWNAAFTTSLMAFAT